VIMSKPQGRDSPFKGKFKMLPSKRENHVVPGGVKNPSYWSFARGAIVETQSIPKVVWVGSAFNSGA
jgi:hypothetical protein